ASLRAGRPPGAGERDGLAAHSRPEPNITSSQLGTLARPRLPLPFPLPLLLDEDRSDDEGWLFASSVEASSSPFTSEVVVSCAEDGSSPFAGVAADSSVSGAGPTCPVRESSGAGSSSSGAGGVIGTSCVGASSS